MTTTADPILASGLHAVGGTRATVGAILQAHLLSDSRCRRRWQSRATRTRRGTLNQAAVAQVLAEWLWDNGEICESDVLLPRRLKDKVSRALSGDCLTPQTLRVFIDAFDIPGPVADRLWDAHLDAPPTEEGPL